MDSRRSSITTTKTGRTAHSTTPHPTRSTIKQCFNSEPPNSLQPTRSTLKKAKRLSKDWGPLHRAGRYPTGPDLEFDRRDVTVRVRAILRPRRTSVEPGGR